MTRPAIEALFNSTFSYELAPEPIRQWRQEELISELRPACNPRSG